MFFFFFALRPKNIWILVGENYGFWRIDHICGQMSQNPQFKGNPQLKGNPQFLNRARHRFSRNIYHLFEDDIFVLRNPTNSSITLPQASSLNIPSTFLLNPEGMPDG